MRNLGKNGLLHVNSAVARVTPSPRPCKWNWRERRRIYWPCVMQRYTLATENRSGAQHEACVVLALANALV